MTAFVFAVLLVSLVIAVEECCTIYREERKD